MDSNTSALYNFFKKVGIGVVNDLNPNWKSYSRNSNLLRVLFWFSSIVGVCLAFYVLIDEGKFGVKVTTSETAYKEVENSVKSLRERYLIDTSILNRDVQAALQEWQMKSNQILENLSLDTLDPNLLNLESFNSIDDITSIPLGAIDSLRIRKYLAIEGSSKILLDELHERIAEKKKQISSSITSALICLFFSCFAGLAFLFIYKDSNELIRSRKVILYGGKNYDSANLFLSAALAMWVIIELLIFYRLLFYPINEVIWFTIISLASTANSFFFLRAMLEFDYKPPGPSWKNYNWYKNGLGNKKVITTIALGALGLTILVGAFTAKIGDKSWNWGIRIPDMILSMITIALLWLHLRSAFIERGKREYNSLVLFTLILVLFIQILPLPVFKNSSFIQGFAPVLSALYRILLISLFLFLSFSWVDFFRGRRLNIEKEQIEKEKATQYSAYKRVSHRLNNFLATHLGGTIHAYENTSEVKENKRFSEIIKSLSVYTSTLIKIHDTVETKKEGKKDKSLYDFLQDLESEFNQLFLAKEDRFFMDVHEDCRKIYSDEDDHTLAIFIGTCLNELITNANKHRENNRTPKWVSVKVKSIKDILHISVSDKNGYFDLEEIIKRQREEGVYHGITTIDDGVFQRGGKFDKSEEHEPGNTVNIYYPIKRGPTDQ